MTLQEYRQINGIISLTGGCTFSIKSARAYQSSNKTTYIQHRSSTRRSPGGKISHRGNFAASESTRRRTRIVGREKQQQRERERVRKGRIRLSGRISVYRPNKPAFNGPLELGEIIHGPSDRRGCRARV